MSRRVVFLVCLVLVASAAVSTGAFTDGDEAVQGIYLNPADTTNGEQYAELDADGELRVSLTDLNPRATTTLDSVFTVTSTYDRAEVWLESGSDAVTFYRMDTRQPITSRASAVELSKNETLTVGIRVETGTAAVDPADLAVHALVPTPTPSGSPTPGPSPTPTPTEAAPSTPTATSVTATATPGPTTTTPGTTTTPVTTTTTTTTGTTTTVDSGATPGTTTAPSTTRPPTTQPPTTQTPTPETTAPPTSETTTAEGTPTPTPGNTTTDEASLSPPGGTDTSTGTPTETAPPSTTATDQIEVGGLSLPELGALLLALALLPLLFFAYRWFSAVPAVTVQTTEGSGLRVDPGDFDPDVYEVGDGAVAFRFTRSDAWTAADGDAPVTLSNVVTVTNTSDDSLVVTPRADEALAAGLSLVPVDADGDEWPGTYRLVAGEETGLTLVFPPDFDPDGDLTVVFDGEPVDE